MHNSILQWFASKFLDRALSPRELLSVRKWLYGALILVLFTASFFWRHYLVEAQANELVLREESRGDLELSGAVLRLTLTGSRGLATCALWVNAIETKKKNQWSELEFQVRWLTRLQPHFIRPWLFQSWNLAYNVSVECDRISDKYYYITRGIQLLAEGERQNRDNPDMRFEIGFYTQHKICGSDETNVHRSLFQLSCIPPNERDPARFWNEPSEPGGAKTLNLEEFQKFCQEHPRLVRRLREGMRRETRMEQDRQFTCERPEDVVQFLTDNWRVPSVYEGMVPTPEGTPWRKNASDPKKPVEERFPVLPPPRKPAPPQRLFMPTNSWVELTTDSPLNEEVDGHSVARAWFGYAQEPIPDSDKFPGFTLEVTDRARQRRPRGMTTLLFRQQPALMQSHRCDALQVEGWFDDATPWEIRGWFPGPDPVKISAEGLSSLKSWQAAAEMWRLHGERNLMWFPTYNQERNKRELAEAYWKRSKTEVGSLPYAPSNIDANASPRDRERQTREQLENYISSLPEDERPEYEAARFMYEYNFYRKLSNFHHHFIRSQTESKPETVRARQLLFDAETLRLQASFSEALKAYWNPLKPKESGLIAWRDVLLADGNKDFREDRGIQEHTAEFQLKYLDLVNEYRGQDLKRLVSSHLALMQEAGQMNRMAGGGVTVDCLGLLLANYKYAPGTLSMFKGPFDIELHGITPDQAARLVGLQATPGSGALVASSTVPVVQSRRLLDPSAIETVKGRRGVGQKKPEGEEKGSENAP